MKEIFKCIAMIAVIIGSFVLIFWSLQKPLENTDRSTIVFYK